MRSLFVYVTVFMFLLGAGVIVEFRRWQNYDVARQRAGCLRTMNDRQQRIMTNESGAARAFLVARTDPDPEVAAANTATGRRLTIEAADLRPRTAPKREDREALCASTDYYPDPPWLP